MQAFSKDSSQEHDNVIVLTPRELSKNLTVNNLRDLKHIQTYYQETKCPLWYAYIYIYIYMGRWSLCPHSYLSKRTGTIFSR